MRVAVVGAGWAGAACARTLHDAGCSVEIFEQSTVIGGHARVERLDGVVYEPNGAHIFHTDDEEVARFVERFGVRRRYEHQVKTFVHPGEDDEGALLSWPPQVDELRTLPMWPQIELELERLPTRAGGESFEEYAISLMGETLYRLFMHGYTVKQWGSDPRALSSSFAPKRLDLRTDGDRRLFRDRYQFFEPEGFNRAIEQAAAGVPVHFGASIGIEDLVDLGSQFDACVVTAALDVLLGRPDVLAWRGVELRSTFIAVEDPGATVTPAYVVNYPDLRYPFTRTVETKHASGQLVRGTVVSEEHPGTPQRHYPVPTVDHTYERRNVQLQGEIRAAAPIPVYFCGRLANYQYIDQDDAIRQGIDCAREILSAS